MPTDAPPDHAPPDDAPPDDTPPDDTRELLRRARAGDRGSMQEMLARHGPRLLHRIRLMMGERARAIAESQDLLQTVFAKVVENLDQFEPNGEGALLRWATRIARNAIRAEVRRKRERSLERFCTDEWARLLRDESTPSEAVSRREQVERLVEALDGLPEDEQRVIELRHFEGKSFREIGTTMGRSENAVQHLQARAVTRLGERLRRPGKGKAGGAGA